MKTDVIQQLREATDKEEILRIAEENSYPLDEAGAEELFSQLHTSGEIADDELSAVAGGGCTTKVNGVKYTVVTNFCDCFTGCHKPGFEIIKLRYGEMKYGDCLRTDNVSLRNTWKRGTGAWAVLCGNCMHLEFKNGIGYCGMSGK